MDWVLLGSIGEFVGGIAVVVSLIYVGLQVRQSSNSVRFHLRQHGVRQWWDGGGRARFSQKFVDLFDQIEQIKAR